MTKLCHTWFICGVVNLLVIKVDSIPPMWMHICGLKPSWIIHLFFINVALGYFKTLNDGIWFWVAVHLGIRLRRVSIRGYVTSAATATGAEKTPTEGYLINTADQSGKKSSWKLHFPSQQDVENLITQGLTTPQLNGKFTGFASSRPLAALRV